MERKLNEPEWKNDLVKRIWKYAKEANVCSKELTEGLGDLITNIRFRCDRCGIHPSQTEEKITHYQCCWVHTDTEDYCPKLCLTCHRELMEKKPHAVVSV